MTIIQNHDVTSRLAQYHWHDSLLLEMHGLLRGEVNHMGVYDFRLDVDLIIGRSEGKYRFARKTLLFPACRFVYATIDFYGMAVTQGQIAELLVHEEPTELRSLEETFRSSGFSDIRIPVDDCICFQLKLINPGGQVAIWAEDLEIIDTAGQSKA